MLRNFFYKMVYGNPNKEDLKKGDTQGNRFKLFFTVIQVRFWQLMHLNLIYALFCTPVFLIFYFYLGAALNEPKNAVPLLFYILLTSLPFLLLMGPATAGFTNVIMKWAGDGHAWTWADFKEGMKNNWKQSVVVMLINGVLLLMFYFNFLFYGNFAKDSVWYQFVIYIMILIILLFCMINMFVFPLLVKYKLKLRHVVKNAFLLAMVNLPVTFVVLIASIIIFMSFVIFGEMLAFIPVYILGYSLPGMIILSYINFMFDKYARFIIDDSCKKEPEE